MTATELLSAPSTQTAGVVEVRIRHVSETTGPTLGWFPLGKLEHLIGELLRWGIYDDVGRMAASNSGSVVGSFRLGNDVFFDIVIDPESSD